MILYQASTIYHIFNFMLHKAAYHRNETAILLYPSWAKELLVKSEKLYIFFDKVVVFDIGYNAKNDRILPERIRYLKKILNKEKIELSKFDEIHVGGAQQLFGAYLYENNIGFHFWEEAPGLLGDPTLLTKFESHLPEKVAFCLKRGLYDGNFDKKNIKKVANVSLLPKDKDWTDVIDFDPIKVISKLDEKTRGDIVSFFTNTTTFNVPKNSVIILTQHMANLLSMSLEEQAYIYQLFADYFFSNKHLIIKPHPNDDLYYKELFQDATVIREKFPSEIIPAMFDNKPDTIATIASTAISSLKGYFDNSVELGIRFQDSFKLIHKYFVLGEIYKNYTEELRVKNIGAIEKVVEALFVGEKKADRKFWIVDDISTQEKYSKSDIQKLLESSNENDIFAFINSKDDYLFYDPTKKELFEYIIPVVVEKSQTREENFFADEEDEVFYIFSKNKELLKQISTFKWSRDLKYTGLKVRIKNQTLEEQQIVLLETMVKGAENTLMQLSEGKDVSLTKKSLQNIKPIRYSNPKLRIKELSETQKRLRILEGILKATEERMEFYIK